MQVLREFLNFLGERLWCGGINVSKVTGGVSGFYNSVENPITFVVMFQKVTYLEILKSSLLTRVAGLQTRRL